MAMRCCSWHVSIMYKCHCQHSFFNTLSTLIFQHSFTQFNSCVPTVRPI
uniref:Uncharacterized protein n=1 Tax=Lotus japonicus TaxID=34305 RepID=I3SJA1_LOTJA|nr:unknown [Lotus japonicus]